VPFPFPLSRKQQHDPRSKAYPAAASSTLRSATHTPPPLSRRLDQGQVGSCEGNGSAHVLGSRPLHKPWSRYLTEPDALEIYRVATTLDAWPQSTYPEQDDGTSNLGAALACRQLRYIDGFEHSFGLDHTLHTLVEFPLLLGVPWSESMFEPDANGFVWPKGYWVGGHAFEAFGINVRGKYVWCLNSWPHWGLRGTQLFKISFASLEILLREGGEATRFIRN